MRYKGIVEITLKPDVPDVNGKSLLAALRGSGITDIVDVRSGKVIEVEFDSEPHEAAEKIDNMARQLLAHSVTEQFAYRLQMIGDQGFGETTHRYSDGPTSGMVAETPMRYQVDEHDVKEIDLRGKIPAIDGFTLVSAEWVVKHPRFVIVRYEKDGVLQTLGVRMDLEKHCFLDDLPDPQADQILKGLAETVWQEVALGIKEQTPFPKQA